MYTCMYIYLYIYANLVYAAVFRSAPSLASAQCVEAILHRCHCLGECTLPLVGPTSQV